MVTSKPRHMGIGQSVYKIVYSSGFNSIRKSAHDSVSNSLRGNFVWELVRESVHDSVNRSVRNGDR
jgi:hypothetical protein